jgi:bacterioferritin-associated ferredoxin
VIVCSCFKVSDREVRAAIKHGATTLDALRRECDAGGGCGTCEPTLCAMLQRHTPAPGAPRGWLHRRTEVPHAG